MWLFTLLLMHHPNVMELVSTIRNAVDSKVIAPVQHLGDTQDRLKLTTSEPQWPRPLHLQWTSHLMLLWLSPLFKPLIACPGLKLYQHQHSHIHLLRGIIPPLLMLERITRKKTIITQMHRKSASRNNFAFLISQERFTYNINGRGKPKLDENCILCKEDHISDLAIDAHKKMLREHGHTL